MSDLTQRRVLVVLYRQLTFKKIKISSNHPKTNFCRVSTPFRLKLINKEINSQRLRRSKSLHSRRSTQLKLVKRIVPPQSTT